MTWGPNKNGDEVCDDSIKKIVETDPTGPPKKVTHKDLGKSGRVSVPFFKIQSPMFEKKEFVEKASPEDVNLPPVIRTADFDLFAKEATLTGWEVRKLSRTKAEVDVGDGYRGHYVRKGKRWRLDRVSKMEPKFTPYDTPLTKLVERDSVRDIEAMQDSVFLDHIDEAIKSR